MKTITASPSALAKAFETWLAEYQANPDKFNDDLKSMKPKSYGQRCATTLQKYLKQK